MPETGLESQEGCLVAVIGNVFEGIHLVGPYASKEEAEKHLNPLVCHREDYTDTPSGFAELVAFENS